MGEHFQATTVHYLDLDGNGNPKLCTAVPDVTVIRGSLNAERLAAVVDAQVKAFGNDNFVLSASTTDACSTVRCARSDEDVGDAQYCPAHGMHNCVMLAYKQVKRGDDGLPACLHLYYGIVDKFRAIVSACSRKGLLAAELRSALTAAEELQLSKMVDTRWNSMLKLLTRVVPVYKLVNAAVRKLDAKDLPTITNIDCTRAGEMIDVLAYFKTALAKVEGDKKPTISVLLQTLRQLHNSMLMHANEDDASQEQRELARYYAGEVMSRFHGVLGAAEKHGNLDPSWQPQPAVYAAVLDPHVPIMHCLGLHDTQANASALFDKPAPNVARDVTELDDAQASTASASLVGRVVSGLQSVHARRARVQQDQQDVHAFSGIEYWLRVLRANLDKYRADTGKLTDLINLKMLAPVALAWAAVPATSAPSERVFSKLNWFDSPRRSRFKYDTLCNMLVVGAWAQLVGFRQALDIARAHLKKRKQDAVAAVIEVEEHVDDECADSDDVF